jgi:hypothetical protein
MRTQAWRTFGAAAVLILVLATGCGSRPASPAVGAPQSPSTVASLPHTPTPEPWPSRYPGSALFSDAIDLITYRLAYDECIVLSPSQLAAGFGGDPADVHALASRYASATVPDREVPAARGCLDGLQAQLGRTGP